MGEHTPGPWVARMLSDDLDLSHTIDAGRVPVADVYGVNYTADCEANARLISEAPAMKAALEAIDAATKSHIDGRDLLDELPGFGEGFGSLGFLHAGVVADGSSDQGLEPIGDHDAGLDKNRPPVLLLVDLIQLKYVHWSILCFLNVAPQFGSRHL